ncbi:MULTISPECIES: bifunctional 2-polyprenyl-6-hydroxyphenol methylase/3-demethylubiquinol 3-O-methyltransferase UbiG [unclassified Azospirillum]|uniref:class I SAM-dependent methyltransferase n=1 Tax=unclassified Azospirillum TaxID=2630922 RepID=UPI000B65984E|nr:MULTISPECIES: class I SAM-dependent methyltransferase [unclassified Azospirillum]SNS57680.1 Methyltransferase domain-containing protein [Azospirillum sp. RU38E]SNS77540.1 Methyltransferase domain-containing protein [Azospirillum sp. RU37A]
MQQTPMHPLINKNLLATIPSGLSRVVEVGCSSGALAAAYRATNPGVHYVGVEIDAQYAAAAAAHCSEILVGDIEQMDLAMVPAFQGAQAWIFGDVLEHLRNPWEVLTRIRAILPPGGYLIICIPNVQHWSVQIMLATGQFRYVESGLLDRTHLRWFTRVTMLEMLFTTGYRVEQAKGVLLDETMPDFMRQAITAIVEAQGGNAQIAIKDALPFQFVVRAVAND